MGLPSGRRIPKDVLVRQWFGISDDEGSRATFPGRFKDVRIKIGMDLLGEPMFRKGRKWYPARWRENVYPLLNEVWRPDRVVVEESHAAAPGTTPGLRFVAKTALSRQGFSPFGVHRLSVPEQ